MLRDEALTILLILSSHSVSENMKLVPAQLEKRERTVLIFCTSLTETFFTRCGQLFRSWIPPDGFNYLQDQEVTSVIHIISVCGWQITLPDLILPSRR